MSLYKSPHANLCINVRASSKEFHPITGVVIGEKPALRAEFGLLGGEYRYTNPETGEETTGANISGHFFNSQEAAERLDWSDAERETVEIILDQKCEQLPAMVQKVIPHRPVPVAPWATYDQADVEEVVEYAIKLGLVPQTVAYERATAGRADVLEPLEAVLGKMTQAEQDQATPDDVLDLDALAVPAGGLAVGSAPRTSPGGIVL